MELLFFIFVFHNIYISFFLYYRLFSFIYYYYFICFKSYYLETVLLMILFATEVRTISLYTFPIKTSVASVSFWNFVKIIFFEKILDFFFFIFNFSKSFLIRFYFHFNICIISTVKFFTFWCFSTDCKIISVSIILKLIIVLPISTRWFFYYLLLNKDFSFFWYYFLLCKISDVVLGIFKFIVF